MTRMCWPKWRYKLFEVNGICMSLKILHKKQIALTSRKALLPCLDPLLEYRSLTT